MTAALEYIYTLLFQFEHQASTLIWICLLHVLEQPKSLPGFYPINMRIVPFPFLRGPGIKYLTCFFFQLGVQDDERASEIIAEIACWNYFEVRFKWRSSS